MNSKTKGILCIITAAFCFAFMSLCVRLAGDLPSMQKILFRNLLAFFIVGAGLVRKPEKLEIHKGDLKFLFLRSICGTVGIVCNFYAIDHLVLSDANMLNKLSPFFTIIFSYFLLKERLTLFQEIAVVVAFMGALFIIKPTGNMTDPAALIGMLGGAGAGAAYSFVRVLGKEGEWKADSHVFLSLYLCVCTAISYWAFCSYEMVAGCSYDRSRIWRCRRSDLCDESIFLCSGKRNFCF